MVQVHRYCTMPRLMSFDPRVLQAISESLVESAVSHLTLETIHGVKIGAKCRSIVAMKIGSSRREKVVDHSQPPRMRKAQCPATWFPPARFQPFEISDPPRLDI